MEFQTQSLRAADPSVEFGSAVAMPEQQNPERRPGLTIPASWQGQAPP
tara:strand:- start:409 stop:552 length:144 start_codon:yes stop_codon:yes gene_type:complete